MEGDLNLSQMLGGLRIANNVDTPPGSPGPPPSSESEARSSAHSLQQAHSRHYDDDNHYHVSNTSRPPSSSSRGVPTQATTIDYHQAYPPSNNYPSPPSMASRPTSTYSQYGAGSAGNVQGQPMYPDYNRMSREVARPPATGHPPLSHRHTTRDRSDSDRSFRQSVPKAPLPSRGNSRAPGQAGYTENGPLPSSEEWKERGATTVVQKTIDRNGVPTTRVVKKGVKDFNFGRTLGEGSYSTVLAATDRTTLKEYAIKVLDKRHIIKEKKVKYVNIEKDTLNILGEHPGIVRLYYTFQDERSLYFVLDLATGGELLGVLKKMTTFDEECTRFYAAQILDAVAYMHSRGVIHRDLKPENVLLDEKMHIKITDFGTAKILEQPKAGNGLDGGYPGDPEHDTTRANSFVGTAEYVSPELLTDKAACKASDLWALGCIIFQLLSGRPPFKAANEYQTFQKIVNLEYEFPKGFPPVARDLVERLLVLDPTKRLTIDHIKNHQFFEGIEWGRKLWIQKAPRLKPYVPPPSEPKIISLNGPNGFQNGINGSSASVGRPPVPRVITELPPPSQLDIEWSPVLTKTSERILKLGNAMVTSAPALLSPDGKGGINGHNGTDTPKKFTRFFTGGGPKRRQRLVMVTTSARIIIAAAGGDDKRMKTDINLLGLGVVIRQVGNATTSNVWAIDTRDKTYTFEDSKNSASEWLECCERAKEIAQANNFNGDDGYNGSNLSSPASTLGGVGGSGGGSGVLGLGSGGGGGGGGGGESSNGHHFNLNHHHHYGQDTDRESIHGKNGDRNSDKNKRFSKRSSRGFAAVF
ncbi:kinase-like domain-containing protein [Peziza echinospora]|nr:kinase-like domain-containing protein [Peziza echinospora]